MNSTLTEAFQYILRNYHFIASKLFKMHIEIDDTINPPTACTDGTYIKFHSDFILSLNQMQIITLIAHEVLHVIFCHHLRMRGRDGDLWNVACDHAINLLLVSMGFTHLDNWLCDSKYAGMSAEDIYAALQQQSQQEQDRQKQQSKESGGSFEEPRGADGQSIPEDQLTKEMENAKVDIQQSRNTVDRIIKGIKESSELSEEEKESALNKHGKGMMELFESIREFTETKIDWQEVINRFIFEKAQTDYSFMKPHAALTEETGFFMPSIEGKAFGGIAMALDVSGSTARQAMEIASESFHCLSQMEQDEPCLELWYVSTHVHKTITIDSPEQVELIKGGGTAFKSFFEAFQDTEKQGLIFVTDGIVYDMDQWTQPPCDVLWILTRRNARFEQYVPFGECIHFNQ